MRNFTTNWKVPRLTAETFLNAIPDRVRHNAITKFNPCSKAVDILAIFYGFVVDSELGLYDDRFKGGPYHMPGDDNDAFAWIPSDRKWNRLS